MSGMTGRVSVSIEVGEVKRDRHIRLSSMSGMTGRVSVSRSGRRGVWSQGHDRQWYGGRVGQRHSAVGRQQCHRGRGAVHGAVSSCGWE